MMPRGPCRLSALRGGPALLALGLAVLSTLAAAPLLAQTETVRITGRVTDEATGRPVVDAEVSLGIHTAVTDASGAFAFDAVQSGRYSLRVRHLAFGAFSRRLAVAADDLRVGVTLSETAIALRPVVVDVRSADERAERSSGTRRNVVTREQIEESLGTAGNLGTVLERSIPGVRLRSQPGRSGDLMCIEFRSGRSLDNPLACHDPAVIMDGVRVSNPQILYQSLQLESVERLEVIPPGEAGVMYGTDSQYGVLLIETRRGQARREASAGRERRGIYEWDLEPEPYNWAKVFGTAFVANAAGMALGALAANQCLSFEGLDEHFLESDCGSWSTAGARLAMVSLPVGAVTFGVHRSGRTTLSTGGALQAAVGSLLIGIPGFVMYTAGGTDAFPGADWVGGGMLLIGVPLVATFADRLFREVRR